MLASFQPVEELPQKGESSPFQQENLAQPPEYFEEGEPTPSQQVGPSTTLQEQPDQPPETFSRVVESLPTQ